MATSPIKHSAQAALEKLDLLANKRKVTISEVFNIDGLRKLIKTLKEKEGDIELLQKSIISFLSLVLPNLEVTPPQESKIVFSNVEKDLSKIGISKCKKISIPNLYANWQYKSQG